MQEISSRRIIMSEIKGMKYFLAIILVGLVLTSGYTGIIGHAESQDTELILRAAVQDEMKTNNILNSNDVWTSHVLWNCYEGVVQGNPNTLDPVPYILIGLETNGQPGIQENERMLPPKSTGFLPPSNAPGISNEWKHNESFQNPANSLTEAHKNRNQIIAYYDFTNVTFHDGEQADIRDVLFSYHILAMHPNWYTGIAPLMNDGGLSGGYSSERWLWVWQVDDGDTNDMTAALRFQITINYAQLWVDTLSIPLFPQHVWESTGELRLPDGTYRSNLHSDFGYAIDSGGYGVPTDHGELAEFNLMGVNGAMDWDPRADEVIGTGMFKFKEFIPGQHSKIVRNEEYLVMETGGLSIHKPHITAVLFIKYNSPTQATMALKRGDVDIILWSIPPDFINDLNNNPNITIVSNPEPGFFYLAFNMRKSMFGYPKNDPTLGDKGKHLRRAIAHIVNKKMIVDVYLQGYGIIAEGPVSSLNTFWFNSSLPKYDFNIQYAMDFMDQKGLVDGDSNIWRDIDLYEGGEQDGEIEIIAPTADYDPIRAQACLLIREDMRSAGINVKCTHLSFGALLDRINNRDFDMYILGWSIGSTDPDYLYSFFYSMNADRGQNYPGYRSEKFDEIILKSRSETDPSERQELIRWAQGILLEDLPYNVLYYRKNLEAYRSDRFTGWVVTAKGSIFNYWSLMNIKRPTNIFLRTTITVASAVSSNNSEPITVTVRDQDGNRVKDAMVNITVDLGNLTLGGNDYGNSWEGLSNINGQVSPNFRAPYIKPTNVSMVNGTKVSITVKASKGEYDDSALKSVFISVFPVGVPFLSVTIDLTHGDLVNEGESTEIDIRVRDQDQKEVDSTRVTIFATPTDLTIAPNNGTTSNGGKLEGIVLTAPEVDEDTVYTIQASPSKASHKGINGTTDLTVIDVIDDFEPDDFTFIILIAVISIIAASSVVYFLRRRRR